MIETPLPAPGISAQNAEPLITADRVAWLRSASAFLVLAAWCVFWNKLRIDWTTNDQYGYGWFVPPFAGILLALRWPHRPVARGGGAGRSLSWIAGVSLLLLLPVRLIEEPNADWRLLEWAHACLLMGITLTAIAWTGGLPWLQHFAFPIFFLLLAVPWPSGPEQAVVQSLMRWVAWVAAEAMNLLGIPATQQGNLIQVRGQMVGVDEACSGIRSLQTMLMASLFLGEMSHLNGRAARCPGDLRNNPGPDRQCPAQRVISWIAAQHGTHQLEHFHDRAGLSVLVFIFVGLILANQYLERGQKKLAPAPVHKPSEMQKKESLRGLNTGWLIGAGAWLLAVEVAAAGWYGSHERGLSAVPSWTVALPTDAPEISTMYGSTTYPATCCVTMKAAPRTGSGCAAPRAMHAFFFRWEPGAPPPHWPRSTSRISA